MNLKEKKLVLYVFILKKKVDKKSFSKTRENNEKKSQ